MAWGRERLSVRQVNVAGEMCVVGEGTTGQEIGMSS